MVGVIVFFVVYLVLVCGFFCEVDRLVVVLSLFIDVVYREGLCGIMVWVWCIDF